MLSSAGSIDDLEPLRVIDTTGARSSAPATGASCRHVWRRNWPVS
jgi:hypothetical protein